MISIVPVARDEWERLFQNIPVSNLLQCWAYGEMKLNIENWVPNRFKILKNESPIGLVQVLTKSVLATFEFVRINRGPLFFSPTIPKEDLQNTYQILFKKFGLIHGRPTFLAPELWDDLHNENILPSSKKWIFLRGKGWSSAVLDLQITTTEMRAGLTGKWRNQLSAAEKKGLQAMVSESTDDLQWLETNYQQSMARRNFQGLPVNSFKELINQLQGRWTMVMGYLPHNKHPLGSVFVAEHGSTATYLIGVNDNRSLTGLTNLMLWRAALRLQEKGIKYFDLGGIDEKNNPGITHFKRGLNGKEYSLPGDFLVL